MILIMDTVIDNKTIIRFLKNGLTCNMVLFVKNSHWLFGEICWIVFMHTDGEGHDILGP